MSKVYNFDIKENERIIKKSYDLSMAGSEDLCKRLYQLKEFNKLLGLNDSSENFVLCGGRKSYVSKNGEHIKGLNELRKDLSTLEEQIKNCNDKEKKGELEKQLRTIVETIYSNQKKNVGKNGERKSFKDAIKSIDNGFAHTIGVWLPHGYVIVDTDQEEESLKLLNRLEEEGIKTTKIKTVHGYHHIFKYAREYSRGELVNGAGCITKSGIICDYRTDKGYIVLPYADASRSFENITEIQPLPEWLLWTGDTTRKKANSKNKKILKNDKKEKKKDESKENFAVSKDKFAKGTRNNRLFRELCKYIKIREFRNFEDLYAIAVFISNTRCDPPYDLNNPNDVQELKSMVNSALTYKKPMHIGDNGRLLPSVLADTIEKDIHYKQYFKSDFIYEDDYYKKIEDKEIIQNKINSYLEEEYQTENNINQVFKMLQIKNTIPQDDNANKIFINIENGLININDYIKDVFKIYPHTHEIFTNFKIPCEYDFNINYKNKFFNSRFYEFLTTTFGVENDLENNNLLNDDREMPPIIKLIQEIFGATLMPNPKLFKKAIFLLGEGSNGKSLLLNILQSLHGNIFSTVPLKAIDSDKFQLANMVGKNINIDADASGTRLEETSNFKMITTGDAVSLEQKGKQATNGIINNVMLIALNKMPSTTDKSYGFFRRHIIIPFNKSFLDEADYKQAIIEGKKNVNILDANLENDILNGELDIVLWFSLEGLKRLVKNKYKVTKNEEVERITKEHHLENDSVLAFYEDNKNSNHIEKRIKAKVLYKIYELWCEENSFSPVNNTTFGKAISKYFEKKKTGGAQNYINIPLNNFCKSFIEKDEMYFQ